MYCSIFQGNLVGSERLFLNEGTKEGAGSFRYHEQIVGLVRGKESVITPYMKFDKLNPYGLRKGAATHALSGTTAPPSVAAVARRGEWTISTVLDCYWHYGAVGDHYLGRILCGLNPNDQDFAMLPPHWDVVDPLGNATILEGMQTMYGAVMEKYRGRQEDPTGFLLRCLACVVYHARKLLEAMVKYPGAHDFSKIPILHNTPLLEALEKLVTTKPTLGKFVRVVLFFFLFHSLPHPPPPRQVLLRYQPAYHLTLVSVCKSRL